MADFKSALDALQCNDAEAAKLAFRKGKHDAINTKVSDGMYGGCQIPDTIKHEEGDTLLHLAMRNQKWGVKRVCVADLSADSCATNAKGMTPPGMQMVLST